MYIYATGTSHLGNLNTKEEKASDSPGAALQSGHRTTAELLSEGLVREGTAALSHPPGGPTSSSKFRTNWGAIRPENWASHCGPWSGQSWVRPPKLAPQRHALLHRAVPGGGDQAEEEVQLQAADKTLDTISISLLISEPPCEK